VRKQIRPTNLDIPVALDVRDHMFQIVTDDVQVEVERRINICEALVALDVAVDHQIRLVGALRGGVVVPLEGREGYLWAA
jgi:hypothetical protein